MGPVCCLRLPRAGLPHRPLPGDLAPSPLSPALAWPLWSSPFPPCPTEPTQATDTCRHLCHSPALPQLLTSSEWFRPDPAGGSGMSERMDRDGLQGQSHVRSTLADGRDGIQGEGGRQHPLLPPPPALGASGSFPCPWSPEAEAGDPAGWTDCSRLIGWPSLPGSRVLVGISLDS